MPRKWGRDSRSTETRGSGKHHTILAFMCGSMCQQSGVGKQGSLHQCGEVPYTAIDRTSPINYIYCIQLIGSNKKTTVHFNCLKLCYRLPARAHPTFEGNKVIETVEQKHIQIHLTEAILHTWLCSQWTMNHCCCTCIKFTVMPPLKKVTLRVQLKIRHKSFQHTQEYPQQPYCHSARENHPSDCYGL